MVSIPYYKNPKIITLNLRPELLFTLMQCKDINYSIIILFNINTNIDKFKDICFIIV